MAWPRINAASAQVLYSEHLAGGVDGAILWMNSARQCASTETYGDVIAFFHRKEGKPLCLLVQCKRYLETELTAAQVHAELYKMGVRDPAICVRQLLEGLKTEPMKSFLNRRQHVAARLDQIFEATTQVAKVALEEAIKQNEDETTKETAGQRKKTDEDKVQSQPKNVNWISLEALLLPHAAELVPASVLAPCPIRQYLSTTFDVQFVVIAFGKQPEAVPPAVGANTAPPKPATVADAAGPSIATAATTLKPADAAQPTVQAAVAENGVSSDDSKVTLVYASPRDEAPGLLSCLSTATPRVGCMTAQCSAARYDVHAANKCIGVSALRRKIS